MLLTEHEIRTLTDKVISLVKADDASVTVSSNRQSFLRFAANNVLTSGTTQERTANIVVWLGGKRGAANTSDLTSDSLKAMVEHAEAIARRAPVDREYVPSLGKQTYRPANRYFEATANVSPTDRARKIGEVLAECEKNKVIGAGFHSANAQSSGTATKNGNFEFERSTGVGLSVTTRTQDGMSSGYFQRGSNDISKLDVMRIARESIRKALDGRNARTIEPGTYTVILEPQAVADLLGGLTGFFNARNAEEGRSVLSLPGGKTRLGEMVFDEKLNIYSDPWHPELPGSQSATGGIPAQRVDLVKHGVVQTLIYNRYWAKQKDRPATPGPVNTIIEAADSTMTVDDMVRSTPRGILVSRFWYIRGTDARTASSTGLTRDGLWWIENGKIAYPIRNLRFNQSMTRMLGQGNVLGISRPERVGGSEGGGGSLLPALKLREFTFTSQSEAV